jgi:hypothetical protein
LRLNGFQDRRLRPPRQGSRQAVPKQHQRRAGAQLKPPLTLRRTDFSPGSAPPDTAPINKLGSNPPTKTAP